MRFEKITDDKIKIILTLDDLNLKNTSVKNLFSESTLSQDLIQSMINQAVTEIGFDTEDKKLLVEAIMISNEECVFTITKLYDDILPDINSQLLFKFETIDSFIDLCIYLNNINNLNLNYIFKNFSLIEYHSYFYLRCNNVNNFRSIYKYLINIFSEFGDIISYSSGFDGILNEYGKVVI